MSTTIERGSRVKILPHSDLFMRGVRYANVTSVKSSNVYLATDWGSRHVVKPHEIVEV